MSDSDSELEVRGENDIDIIDVFLQEFKEYQKLYVIPEFGKQITHEKLYEFIMKNK
jgi:hypothetical protein